MRDRSGSLLKRTRELLAATSLTHAQISRATGLSEWWLSQILNEKIHNPSVNSVQKLYEYLSGERLGV